MNTSIANATAAQAAMASENARQRYLAVGFIEGARKEYYGKLVEQMENDYLQSIDRWPKTIHEAYSLLLNWKNTEAEKLHISGGRDGATSPRTE